MGNLLGPPLLPGNSCQTLLNGTQIFPAMLDAIHSAKKSITFETFIYWSGSIGQEFTDALSDRARAGVKVHVLIDWLGSSKINPRYIKTMRDAGVEVQEYHAFHFTNPTTLEQINHRTHRKLLVIDGRIGFIGGVGIADEWEGNANRPDHWRDNHYRMEGPIVAQVQAAFADNWMKTTGNVLVGDTYFPSVPDSGKTVAQIFKSSSQGGSESMQLMMLLSLASATKNVRIETAYFVPDAITQRYLIDANRRGVSVEIIVPGAKIDEKVVRVASRATWGKLLESGIRIYEYQPAMFHCKQLIADDFWVSIGSANFDNRSFRINDEANLNVLDSKFAIGQVAVFENDKQHSRQITYEQWQKRSLWEKASELIASLFDWEF